MTTPLTLLEQWQELEEHFDEICHFDLRLLFDQDPERGEKYVIDAEGLYLDYSKNHVTDETMHLLIELAKARNLRQQIDAMFSGEKINTTEKRAVLHVALRSPRNASIKVDGHNVIPDVHEVLDKMRS